MISYLFPAVLVFENRVINIYWCCCKCYQKSWCSYCYRQHDFNFCNRCSGIVELPFSKDKVVVCGEFVDANVNYLWFSFSNIGWQHVTSLIPLALQEWIILRKSVSQIPCRTFILLSILFDKEWSPREHGWSRSTQAVAGTHKVFLGSRGLIHGYAKKLYRRRCDLLFKVDEPPETSPPAEGSEFLYGSSRLFAEEG